MPLDVLFWIAIALSATVIAEMIIASILYAKIRRRSQQIRSQSAFLFLGITHTAAHFIPLSVCVALLSMEAVALLYAILSFRAALSVDPQTLPIREAITAEEAHDTMSDKEALSLIEENELGGHYAFVDPNIAAYLRMLSGRKRYQQKAIVNVDVLSAHFGNYDHVTLDSMKQKRLIPANTDYVKVLGKGTLDKHLYVEAHDFSADAVKMIVLTGGHAIHQE